MSDASVDPHCPECGEPIGQTATYCMHCSADLSEEQAAADVDGDGMWDQGEASATQSRAPASDNGGRLLESVRDHLNRGEASSSADGDAPEGLLRPDSLVDNTLTVLVGIVGGLIVGVVGVFVLGIATGSGWAVAFGVIAWLLSTAYLVRRRTVQGAVAKSGYAVALVLLSTPLIALSPVVSVDGGLEERGGLFFVLFVFVVIPAGIAAAVGWIASQFVPEPASGSDG